MSFTPTIFTPRLYAGPHDATPHTSWRVYRLDHFTPTSPIQQNDELELENGRMKCVGKAGRIAAIEGECARVEWKVIEERKRLERNGKVPEWPQHIEVPVRMLDLTTFALPLHYRIRIIVKEWVGYFCGIGEVQEGA